MTWKNNNKKNEDKFEKSSQEKEKSNPFSQEKNFTDIWVKIKQKTEELNCQCYPNTYVWIEKFKDDNY